MRKRREISLWSRRHSKRLRTSRDSRARKTSWNSWTIYSNARLRLWRISCN